MATKTVVCPECGSEAERGRYACAECGALLAAVAVAAHVNGSGPGTDLNAGVAILDEPDVPMPPHADADHEAGPHADAATGGSTSDRHLTDIEPIDAIGAPDAQTVHVPAFDENAPLAATASSSPTPDVLHDLTDSTAIEDAPAETTAPSWPPPGDRGPLAAPEPRTPAGAYLPPSAVLPPLDLPAPAGAALPTTPEPGLTLEARVSRGVAALNDALESVHLTADMPRRVAAAGSGLSALGLVLPWVNTLPGANPLAGYLDRWGLAGPGLWLVFVGLIVLASIAGSSGRTASWPIGLASIATGAFLVGLVWPYVIGGFGRSIGVGVVLAGAIVLAVGGLLDRRGRHDDGDATV